MLATGGDDGTVRLWSVSNPVRPRMLAAKNDAGKNYVFCVAFSPHGRTLAAASSDGTTRLWNISQPGRSGVARQAGRAGQLRVLGGFQPGRPHACRRQCRQNRAAVERQLTRPGRSRSASRSPVRPATSTRLAFSPDGKTLAAGVTDGTAWLWNVAVPARPALLATLTGPARAGVLGGLRPWRPHAGRWQRRRHGPALGHPAASSCGRRLRDQRAAGVASGDGLIQLWRTTGGLIPLGMPVRASAPKPASGRDLVESVAFSPAGTMLATGGDDGTVRLWSASNPARPRMLALSRAEWAAYIPGRRYQPTCPTG